MNKLLILIALFSLNALQVIASEEYPLMPGQILVRSTLLINPDNTIKRLRRDVTEYSSPSQQELRKKAVKTGERLLSQLFSQEPMPSDQEKLASKNQAIVDEINYLEGELRKIALKIEKCKQNYGVTV